MRIKLRVAAITAALLCGLATTVVAAGPAEAATPQCTLMGSHRPSTGGGAVWMPVAADGNRLCWLEKGRSSAAVKALQRALKYCYSQNIKDDGNFGPATFTALWNAQTLAHAKVDGKYGPDSARLLKMASTTSTLPEDCAQQTF